MASTIETLGVTFETNFKKFHEDVTTADARAKAFADGIAKRYKQVKKSIEEISLAASSLLDKVSKYTASRLRVAAIDLQKWYQSFADMLAQEYPTLYKIISFKFLTPFTNQLVELKKKVATVFADLREKLSSQTTTPFKKYLLQIRTSVEMYTLAVKEAFTKTLASLEARFPKLAKVVEGAWKAAKVGVLATTFALLQLPKAVGIAWKAVETFSGWIGKAYNKTKELVQGAKTVFHALTFGLFKSKKEFDYYDKRLGIIGQTLKTLWKWSKIPLVVTGLADLYRGFMGGQSFLGIFFNNLMTLLDPIYDKLYDVQNNILPIINKILTPFVRMLAEGIDKIIYFIQTGHQEGTKLNKIFTGIRDGILEFINAVEPFVTEFVNTLLPVAEEIAYSIIDSLGSIAKKIMPILVKSFQLLLPAVSKLIKSLKEPIIGFIKIVGDMVALIIEKSAPILQVIVEGFTELIKQSIPYLQKAYEALGAFIKALAPLVEILVKVVMQILKHIAAPALLYGVRILLDVFTVFVKSISWTITTIFNFLDKTLPEAIIGTIDWFQDTVDSVVAWASSTYQGFIDGITRMWNNFKASLGLDTMTESATSVVNSMMESVAAPIRAMKKLIEDYIWKPMSDVMNYDFPLIGKLIDYVNFPDHIPMAKGGIVTQPTKALIGEAGPEIVLPLNKTNIERHVPQLVQKTTNNVVEKSSVNVDVVAIVDAIHLLNKNLSELRGQLAKYATTKTTATNMVQGMPNSPYLTMRGLNR